MNKLLLKCAKDNEIFYLQINNVKEYQQIYFSDDTKYSYDYAKYKYASTLIEELYQKIDNVKFIEFVDNPDVNLSQLIKLEWNINACMRCDIFVTHKLVYEISYVLKIDNFVKLEKMTGYVNDGGVVYKMNSNVTPEVSQNNSSVYSQKIPFQLVHGYVNLNYDEMINMSSGDVIMLDEYFDENTCQLNFNKVNYNFLITNNQLIVK